MNNSRYALLANRLKRLCGVSLLCSAFVASALEPYTVDVNTLHLWHFDESGTGPVQPAAGITKSFNLNPANGATLGVTSITNFGFAGNTSAQSNSAFAGPSILTTNVTGANGAFTFEAMIQITNITTIQHIITMDSTAATALRPFQFRIEAGKLSFINIGGGSGTQTLSAPIPTNGSDAFVTGKWFHVAVTYDGAQNTPNNLKLYWSALDVPRISANLLYASNMVNDLIVSGAATLSVGQEYRTIKNNLKGSIDEVRISSIARKDNEFHFFSPDSDLDGLSDSWELQYFRASSNETTEVILAKYNGTNDPDGDTFNNEAEETAGTDPTDPAHTPLDTDKDGYLDSWEIATFGTIVYGPTDDPDKDGFTTAQELAAGSDPANTKSTPDDMDLDGLSDAWEIQYFGNLNQNPGDDFDGDSFSNLDEYKAKTNPVDSSEIPPVRFIPVTDGNSTTDENGYAGSGINSEAFAQDNLITVGNQQFISYYRRHATSSTDPKNNTVLVGRRTLGEPNWEIFSTSFTTPDINDGHNVISIAVDGDGVLHMSWGMHNLPLLYARSTGSVTGSASIVMTSLGTAGMTGQENDVTYPKFQTLADGDVVMFFRGEGASGNGNWYMNRYDIDTDTWSPCHTNASGIRQPLMLGLGDTPNNCFYPDRMALGPDNMLHLAGVFRYNGDSLTGDIAYQTNHRYVYLRSPDGGTTWERSDGSSIALPVVEADWFMDLGTNHVPDIVKDIPEGYSLMNESGMTTDSAGRPIIANWWAEGAGTNNHRRQYHVLFHDGSTWQHRTVSDRTIDDPAIKVAEKELSVSPMGRPAVIADNEGRIIVIYCDNEHVGITAVCSLPLAVDPNRTQWTTIHLTHENIGSWETTYDEERWKRDGVLHMLYQRVPGLGMSYVNQNLSTPVSVIEWNARAYFQSNLPPVITSSPELSAYKDEPYSYQMVAGDQNGDPLTFSATVKPAWLEFNTNTLVLSGTPRDGDVGSHQVTLKVTDGVSDVYQNFEIKVTSPGYNIVPNVVGFDKTIAKTTITDQGFTNGTETLGYVRYGVPGRVLAQSPTNGQLVRLGSPVDITVMEDYAPTLVTTVWNPSAGSAYWTNNSSWNSGVAPMRETQNRKVVFNVAGAKECILNTRATVVRLAMGDGGTATNGNVLRLTAGADLLCGLKTNGGGDWTAIGYSQPAKVTVESNALFATAANLLLARAGGRSYLNIEGGTVQIATTITLGGGTATNLASGWLRIDGGGTLRASGLVFNNTNSVVDVRKGILLLDGNDTVAVNGFISNKTLVAYGGAGTLQVDYNVRNIGYTTITATGPSSVYEDWASENGLLSGSLDDDDGDGRSNLLEYAIGGDPQDSGDFSDPVLVLAGTTLNYSYQQRNDDPSLTYVLQGCTDLITPVWSNVNTLVITNSTEGEYDNVTRPVPLDENALYIRLLVNQP